MAGAEHFDLEFKGLSLIDDASENNDFILSLTPSQLKPTDDHKEISLELSGTTDAQVEKDMDNKGEQDGMLPELHESMEQERSRRKGKLNLRKSLAWDSAFFTEAGVLDPEELSGTMDAQEEKDMDNKGEEDDMLPELHESMEPERSRRKGKLNLRKSLAWDSAFFTEAGVLDPEELSSMVKGAEKIDKNILTRIDEDVERSSDSISTLESDNVALEHIQADLFEDIRASIQRSNKVANVMISTRKEASSKADNGASSASKKADTTSKNVPKLAPRRTIGVQALGMSKSQQKHTDGIQGSRKGVKQDNPHSVIKTGDSTSSLSKPPRLISKVNPTSATMVKRASLSANHVKIDQNNAKTNTVAGKGAQTPKVFASNNACKVLPKPALSSKSSSSRFSASTKMQSSRSSSDNTGSTLSDKAGKSTLPVARRKVVTKPVSQPSSGSILKTPSKTALKNEVSSGNSAISAYLMSSKINSSISPASSISEWSSVSAASSSCSIINERSNKSRISFDTSSCRSLESDVPTLDFTNCSSNQISEKSDQGTSLPKETIRKALTQSDTLSLPHMKPSGLRMPSPKIGFFDGVKLVRTPNGTSQCHSKQSTALPKIGATTLCSPNGRSNMKSKTSELPPARMLTASVNVKSDTQNLPSPISFQDKSPASLNITDAPRDKQCFPSLAPEVHHEVNEESNSYVMDGGSEGVVNATKHVVDVGLDAVNHGDQGVLKNETSAIINEKANLNDIRVVSAEEETSISISKNTETTISELAANRMPFSVKNSGNSDFLDFSKEAVVEVVGKINSALPLETDYKENNL